MAASTKAASTKAKRATKAKASGSGRAANARPEPPPVEAIQNDWRGGSLGDQLRAAVWATMTLNNWGLSQLCRAVDEKAAVRLNKGQLCRFLKWERDLSLQTASELCRALGLRLEHERKAGK